MTGIDRRKPIFERTDSHVLRYSFVQQTYYDNACTVLDIGARGGLQLLPHLHKMMCVHAVEPDPEAARQLREAGGKQFREFHVHELALAGETGERELHVARRGSMSSLLKPDHAEFNRGFGYNRNAPEWERSMETIATRKVRTATLDQFCKENDIGFIDFLKLDTQGTELHILRSGINLLRSGKIGVICAEVALHPIYKGQGYFSEVDVLLRECGFRFVDWKTYRDVSVREDELVLGELHERPRVSTVGDAWYVFNWPLNESTAVFRQSAAIILASEGYFSEAAYAMNEILDDREQLELFRELSKHSRERGWKHFLKRWVPLAIQQWRAKRRR